jgi:Ca2+-binding EF-hand superfamily protein
MQFASAKGSTDINGDGLFSKDEIVQARQKQLDKKFTKLDTNQDGQITMDELNTKKRGVGIAKKADANKDGVITQAEARAYMSQSVDKYMQKKDLNGDGQLDQQERKRKAKSAKS